MSQTCIVCMPTVCLQKSLSKWTGVPIKLNLFGTQDAGAFSDTTQVSRYQKGKTSLGLLEQEIVSGSGIS